MAIDSILDTVRAGMAQERLRLDAASRNIASANVALPATTAAQRWQVGTGDDFAARLQSVPADTREVSDPGHPMADAQGFVHYARVDMVQEMTTLMTASRGYEANVRSFNLLRGMTLRALDIGAK
ncbi:flagellar basal body rod protein FlgC [Stenotrophomonas rhizophila]|uniref:flagellar basal body rod protein FlgC n=1 Tax=Stenotrophomonas rhizophila TaxID=216778 RepID=UPI001AEC2B0C|nr:flagellar basal body rod C-terminal domain-containing protein [Stenotrophomonas rhizophila]